MMNTLEMMNAAFPQAPSGPGSEARGDANGVVVGGVMPKAKVVNLSSAPVNKSSSGAAISDTSISPRPPLKERDGNSNAGAVGKKKLRVVAASMDINSNAEAAIVSFENIPTQFSVRTAGRSHTEGVNKTNESIGITGDLVAMTSGLGLGDEKNPKSKSNKTRKKGKNNYDKKNKKNGIKNENHGHSGAAAHAGADLPILPRMDHSAESTKSGNGSPNKHSKKSKKKPSRINNKKKSSVENSQLPYHMGYVHHGYPYEYVPGRDFPTNADGAAILASIGQPGYANSNSPPHYESNQAPSPDNNFPPPQYNPQTQMHPVHPAYMGHPYAAQFPPEMYQYPGMMQEYYPPPPMMMMNPHEGIVYYNQGGGECLMAYDPNYFYNNHSGEMGPSQNDDDGNGGQVAALNIDAPSFEPKDKLSE